VTPFELGLVLLSALLHSLWNAATKGSASPLGYLLAFEIVTTGATLLLLPFFEISEIPREVWWLLAATAVAHGFYGYFLAMAYTRGELTLVYPIARTTPAFVPLVAVPLLGESLTGLGIGGIGLVVLGMWLVQTGGRVRLRDFATAGAGFAYLTLATTVVYSLLDKQAMAVLDGSAWTGPAPRAVVYYFLLTSAQMPVFAALALPRTGWSALGGVFRTELRSVLLGAAAALASYALILEALRTASVSYVVAVRQTSVLFALLLAVRWLGERPTPARIAGAAATVAGVALIALRG
jgi:drug/metabolite transporter (DMT)-like permease